MQRDPWFSRRWGFMGYGSTPLHYPLHPSIDCPVSVCTVVLHRPRPRCHCGTDRRYTPGSLRGSWKNSVDWIYTLRNTASGSRIFVRPAIVFEKRRGEKKWLISMEAFCRFSWYIVGFKQRLDEIRGRNLEAEKNVQFWVEKKSRNKRSVRDVYIKKRVKNVVTEGTIFFDSVVTFWSLNFPAPKAMDSPSNYVVSGVNDGESRLLPFLDHCVPVDRYTRFDAYVKREGGRVRS